MNKDMKLALSGFGLVAVVLASLLAIFTRLSFGATRGSGTYTQCVGNPCNQLYLTLTQEDKGWVTGSTQSINANFVLISSAINRLETTPVTTGYMLTQSTIANNMLPQGSTVYIQNGQSLQASSTFYISSGSIDGQALFARTSGNVGISSSAPNYLLAVGAGGANFSISANGNVGIGTVSGNAKLVVEGDTSSQTQIHLRDSRTFAAGVGGSLSFLGHTTSAGALGTFAVISSSKENAISGDTAGALILHTVPNPSGNPIERMRIDSTGNVGISSNSPIATLGITGNIIATSSITAYGGLATLGSFGVGITTPATQAHVYLSTGQNIMRLETAMSGANTFNQYQIKVGTATAGFVLNPLESTQTGASAPGLTVLSAPHQNGMLLQTLTNGPIIFYIAGTEVGRFPATSTYSSFLIGITANCETSTPSTIGELCRQNSATCPIAVATATANGGFNCLSLGTP